MIDVRKVIPQRFHTPVWWVVVAGVVGIWLSTLRPGVAGFDAGYYFQAAMDLTAGRNPYLSGDYLYPPLAAWLLVPAVTNLNPTTLAVLFNAVIYSSVLALIAGSFALAGLRPGFKRSPDWWIIPSLGAFCLFSPVTATATGLGNISPLVGALCVWAGVLFARERYVPAAAIVAFASILKIIPVILLIMMFWRAVGTRNRRMLAASIAGAVIVIAGILAPPGAVDFLRGAGGSTKWGIDIGGAAVSIHVWLARLLGTSALNHPEIATVVLATGGVIAAFLGFLRRDSLMLSWAATMVLADLVSPKNCPHLFLAMSFPVLVIFALHTARNFNAHPDGPGAAPSPFMRIAAVLFTLALPWIAASSEFFYFKGLPAGELLLPIIPLVLVCLETSLLLRHDRRGSKN